jgi:hypothetical protein
VFDGIQLLNGETFLFLGGTPKYALIKVPNTSPAARQTRRKAETLQIKEEIKFLYAQKQHLNLQLLHTHLLLANQWQNSWPYIQLTIEEKLKVIFKQKYQSLNDKIEKLSPSMKSYRFYISKAKVLT